MQTGMILSLLLAALAAAAPARADVAYVSNEADNTISVIDLAQMKTVGTIPVGQRPRGIAVTKDGKRILVCVGDDNAIQIVDAATHKITGTLPSGPDPETFALSPAGDRIYIANEDDALVTVIDVEGGKVVARIPTGVEPEGMAVSPDGKTVVNTSETTNMAHVFDADRSIERVQRIRILVDVGFQPQFACKGQVFRVCARRSLVS